MTMIAAFCLFRRGGGDGERTAQTRLHLIRLLRRHLPLEGKARRTIYAVEREKAVQEAGL